MLVRLPSVQKGMSLRTIPGNIFLSRAAAASALGLPPSRQSSNSNSGCRTGFEKETRPESTSVILRMPQPWHPCQKRKGGGGGLKNVTNHERSRNVASKSSRTKQQAPRLCNRLQVEGRENPPAHQFEIQVDCLVREPVVQGRSSLRLTTKKDEANLLGSIIGARSATRAPSFPCTFFSHPTALGLSAPEGPLRRTPKRLDEASPRQHSTRTVCVASGCTARR